MIAARFAPVALALILNTLAPTSAFADAPDTCVSSYENAQVLRKGGDLVRAKSELTLCTNACPEVLARDCAGWLAETSERLAKLTVTPRRKDGATVEMPRVFLDGFLQLRAAEGGMIELNPGEHELKVESSGTAPTTVTVRLGPGETQSLVVELPPLAALPVPGKVETTRPPDYPFIVGGIGLGLMAVGGALGIVGHVEKTNLGDPADGDPSDGCAPNCAKSDVNRIRNEWIAGGIIGGIGVLTLGTATILLVTSDPVVVEGSISATDARMTIRF